MSRRDNSVISRRSSNSRSSSSRRSNALRLSVVFLAALLHGARVESVFVKPIQWAGVDLLKMAWGYRFDGIDTWLASNQCATAEEFGADGLFIEGMMCDATGNVVQLSLENRRIFGSIPAEVTFLSALNALYLGENNLYGSLPATLGKLAMLQYIDLKYNELSGVIPTALANLKNLNVLNLRGNFLMGAIPPTLGGKGSPNIYDIDLSHNSLVGPIPGGLGLLTGLTQLNVAGNELSGSLPPKLNWPSMGALLCAFNFIGGAIPATIGTAVSLQYIELGYNSLAGSLPSTMGRLAALQRLDLLDNLLTGPIPATLSALTGMQTLVLQRNGLTGPIPSGLSALTALSEISLAGNSLSGPIPSTLSTLTALTWISLSSNQLSGPIPDSLLALPTLRVIFLNDNLLSGSVPSTLSALTELQHLSLARNSLSGSLPTALPSLPLLEYADLSGNSFTGAVPEAFFTRTTQWTLDLRSNQLTGSISRPTNGSAYLDANYFTETSFDPSDCPETSNPPFASFRANCLPPASVCPGMPQRPEAACSAFCGLSSSSSPASPPCSGLGSCVLTGPSRVGVCSCDSPNINGENPGTCVEAGAFAASSSLLSSSLPAVTAVGSAAVSETSGALTLTLTTAPNTWGAVLVSSPVRLFSFALRKNGCGRAFAFNVSFSFSMTSANKASGGLAFVVSASASAEAGALPGLGTSGMSARTLAVEFDAFRDVSAKDPSANHIGVNVNASSASIATLPAPVPLADGKVKFAWVEYVPVSDFRGTLVVLVSATSVRPVKGALVASVSLCSVLGPVEGEEESFFFGFTGATIATAGQSNVVHSYKIDTFLPSALAQPPRAPLPTGFAFKSDAFSSLNANRASRHVSVGANPATGAWDVVAAVVNWNTSGMDTWAVKNQMKCGDSWAFAVVSSIEAAYGILFNVSSPPALNIDSLRTALKTNCKGGSPVTGFQYLVKTGRAGGGLTTRAASPRAPQGPMFPIVGFERTSLLGWFGLLLAVQQQPVVALIQATAMSFQNYNGLYRYSDPSCFSFSLNHAITVVGYRLSGVDPAMPHVPAPFWILRNSWGADWGDAGHMRMGMEGGFGVCGINSLPGIYPVVRSPFDPCNTNAQTPSGAPLLNPCGSFACSFEGGSNRCACDGTAFVEVTNADGSRTCAPADVCGLGPVNPCGVGTCVNDGVGAYSCVCPPSYRQGTTVDGALSCAPALVRSSKYRVLGSGVTCALVHQTFGLAMAELTAQNPGVDCNLDLPLNAILNVARSAPLPTCTAYYSTGKSDSCLGLTSRHVITEGCEPQPGQCGNSSLPCVPPCLQAFQTLNPGVVCSGASGGGDGAAAVAVEGEGAGDGAAAPEPALLPPYLSVCVKADPLFLPRVPSCPMLRSVLPGESCDAMRAMVPGHMPLEEFLAINPGINCGKLQPQLPAEVGAPTSFDVCLSGIFDLQLTTCPRPFKIGKGEKCDNLLLRLFGGNRDCFRQINGYHCLDTLETGGTICAPNAAALLAGRCTV